MSERRSKLGANIPCLLFQRSLFPRHQRHSYAAADLASNVVDELSRIKYEGHRRGGRGGMALLRRPAVSSPHVGPIHCLDVDNASGGRFLLAGGHDGTVSVYDLFGTQTGGVGVSAAKTGDAIKPLHRSRRGRRTTPTGMDDHDAPLPRGHVGPITSVQWYPVDSGMFVSSSSDGSVMLWDASTFRPAYAFPIGNKSPRRGGGGGGGGSDNSPSMHPVTCAEMPRVASNGSNHCLIASGCADDVYLCDVDSGSATHQLVGHADRVLAARWSPSQPYHLVSSSRDGTIRLWDVRRSGSTACLHVFDGEDKLLGHGDDDGGSDGHTLRSRVGTKQKRKGGSKRLRHGPNSYAHVQSASSTVRSSRGGSSSSGSAVTNVAFSPDGMYLTSATADGRLALWDARGLNCPTPSPSLDDDASSASASSSLSTWNFNHPPVLSPSYFLGSGETGSCPASRGSKTALVVTQPGSSKSAMIWCGDDDGRLLGFDMHGGGGRPRVVLDGHLEGIASVAAQEGYMRLFTGSRDGMILGWGCPPVRGGGTLGEGFSLGGTGGNRRRRRGVDEDCWNDLGNQRNRGLSLLSR